MQTLKTLVFALLLYSPPGHAFQWDSFSLGYGFLNSGILTESASSSGETSLFGSFTFHFLTANLKWASTDYKYGLRLGYTALPRESADDAVEITYLLITPQFGIPFGGSQRWLWNSGISYMNIQSKGQGGTVVQPNGTGTLTFYRPSNTTSAQLINIETGVVYTFPNSLFVSGDLLFNGLFGDKRNMGLFVNFGYSWGNEPSYGGRTSFGRGY